ncbi:MAG: GMC family oxidoreductase N-terminal domain-containing protein [Proteobacteria bacterium]|nr:GMC family oxidoreductase N-terminal domain-containing protein [Pseudomonadota bacterium]
MQPEGKNASGYDYIIVGSGSAGSLLANRLSANPDHRILVLEAGGSDRNFWLKLPVGYFRTIYDERFARHFDTEPGEGTGGRNIVWPRGRVIGGSSSINGLIFIRGQHEDFDDWDRLGAKGWRYSDVLPFFRRLENYRGGENQFRGKLGEMAVTDLRNDHPYCEAWVKAAQEYGLPFNPDFNAETTYGAGAYQLSINGRWRSSAAAAFLKPARARPNLTVLTGTHTTRVLFDGKRATGVEWVETGQIRQAVARREVILSAGGIQSPQILQLSGIGPADLLAEHNIPLVADAPGVGRNLQDHYQMRTIVRLKAKKSVNNEIRNPVKLAQWGLQWLFNASGPLTVGAGQVGGAACTKYAENGRPDVQFNVMPLSVDKPGTPLHDYPGFTASVWQCHPKSRGTLKIKSTDPFEQPHIDPNYFGERRDRDVIVEGVKMLREIYAQPAFRDLWDVEVIPGKEFQSDDQLWDKIRHGGGTVFHCVGTCRMGTDDNAVVDPNLKVHDVEGLRVIDASVMPQITSANTNAPTLMIAEKGANAVIGSSGQGAG